MDYVVQRSEQTGALSKVRVYDDPDEAQAFILRSNGVHANRSQAEVAAFNGAQVICEAKGGDAEREAHRVFSYGRCREAIECYCGECGIDMDDAMAMRATMDAMGTWGDGFDLNAVVALPDGQRTDPVYYEDVPMLAADVYSMMVQARMRGMDDALVHSMEAD